jgi:Bacteriophage tail sheath protein
MGNLGPFPHGVSWSDVPTSVVSPVASYPGINVVFGSAPLHLSLKGKDAINVPIVANTYEEAVAALGYSDDWETYDLCEHMDAAFVEFGVGPVIYIAVNDPETGAVVFPAADFDLVNGQVDTETELISWTVDVKDATGATTYVEGTDYLVSLSKANTVVITRIVGGAITSDTAAIKVGGKEPSATPIDASDVIGGIDNTTGLRSGLEVIENVFQKTGYVPGVIICPKWSKDPMVASVMEAKCNSINGCFACICLIDIDTAEVTQAQDALEWKNENNIVFPRQQCLFGKPALKGSSGQKVFNFASQQGPLMQYTDASRGNGLPYHSPSNKNLKMNALLVEDGSELPMHLLDANMLNGQGIISALNFVGGWKSWGNRTAAYPATTDVKDMFINVRRMFDYIGNSIVLTIWQKVDEPGNRRLIDAIVNSLSLWLDGLSNTEALLGGRLEFRQDENPTTELLNGHYVFHVYIAVPTPAEWLDFRVEYWVPYVQNLWPQAVAA